MFDLMGFWSAVTVITACLLFGVVHLLMWLTDLWVGRITGGGCKYFLWSKLPEMYKDFNHYNDYMWVAVVSFFSTLVLVFVFLLTTNGVFIEKGITTPVELVSHMATYVAPFFSWVSATIILFFSIDFIARKGYVMYDKISAVLREKGE